MKNTDILNNIVRYMLSISTLESTFYHCFVLVISYNIVICLQTINFRTSIGLSMGSNYQVDLNPNLNHFFFYFSKLLLE